MNDLPEYLTGILDFIFRFGGYFFWLIVLAFVAVNFIRRKSAYKKMQEAAMRLGLEFDGNPYMKQIEVRTASIQQQTQDSPRVLQFITQVLDFVLPLFYFWEMKGKWNGVPVRVYSDKGKSNSGRCTVVRANTETTKPIGLRISAERFLSLGNKDITIGNEELDKMVFVNADDPDRAKMILMSPTLQDALLQAFKFSKFINVEDQYVTLYEEAGNLQNEETLRAALDHVSRTAQALRSASR